MQANLSWPQARGLTATGSFVRREWWLARSIFKTAGNLFWMQWGSRRVALSTDFTLAEYNAGDWTDTTPAQGHCVGIDLKGAIYFASPTILSGATVTATLQVPEPLDMDVTFDLSSDVASVTYPSQVTIPEGSSSVAFPVIGTTDPHSGIVTLSAASTYIGAKGSIFYSYVPPPPAPLPKATFVIVERNFAPNPLFVDYPSALITNGQCFFSGWLASMHRHSLLFRLQWRGQLPHGRFPSAALQDSSHPLDDRDTSFPAHHRPDKSPPLGRG